MGDWTSDVCSSELNLTRRLVALRAAHPALRLGANANWIAEGDLLGFDRVAGGGHVRCLFNLGGAAIDIAPHGAGAKSEEHTSELQSLMRISYAVFCLNKKKIHSRTRTLKMTQ